MFGDPDTKRRAFGIVKKPFISVKKPEIFVKAFFVYERIDVAVVRNLELTLVPKSLTAASAMIAMSESRTAYSTRPWPLFFKDGTIGFTHLFSCDALTTLRMHYTLRPGKMQIKFP